MTTSEPTTDEIVRILRGYADDIRARAATDIPTPPESIAADLLEGYKRVVVDRDREIAALTARAEQAERERDVLKLEFATIEEDGLCSVCKFESSIPLLQCMEDCCFKHRGLSVLSVDGVNGDGTERHGLPQEGVKT